MKKIIITMGLPGSGKTYFSKNYYNMNKNKKPISLINWDYLKLNFPKLSNYELVSKHFAKVEDEVVIDGLFLTTKDIENLLTDILDSSSNILFVIDVVIHFWKEDRESCLWNDIKRRDIPSIITIKNAILEEPDLRYLEDKFNSRDFTKLNFSLVKHDIIRKDTLSMVIDEYALDVDKKEMKLKSDSWCTGGTYVDCYGEESEVSSEYPLDFVELEIFLEKLNPKITNEQKKLIYEECVIICDYSSSDYYGGYCNYDYYECDFNRLLDLLETFDYDMLEIAEIDLIMNS